MPERALLKSMFEAAVAAATPSACMSAFLPRPPKGRTIVVGAGKAAAAMAKALEDSWPGPLEGLVVTRYGHAVSCQRIAVIEAAHPVPDLNGVRAAARMLALVEGAGEDDLVIALISGGGSALLSLPAEGLLLSDKQAINKALLKSGAPIDEMNCVRKHLSAIKGGRLAAAAFPARVVSLVISDVPGDDLAAIASGPTVADPTTFADARAILARYGIDGPAPVIAHLVAAQEETPKPGDRRLARCETHLIASPQQSLLAAAAVARKAGITPVILGDSLEGEARDVGIVMAGIARQVAQHGQPVAAPCVLISGGETTVTVRGKGRGGRNVEYLLSLAVKLGGQSGIHALAGDTDGVDGAEEVAGAIIDPTSLARARAAGLDPIASLDNNDAHTLFQALGDQVVTGPTLTNVNDFRAVLVLPEGMKL
ncbi:glycerate kinase [Labrys sp. KNU-23]|uniref:glycerate kinase type-2 family protein n=1 Tax=Labrys sp. KNU-23 TaxID=2789216 RepID=UPI0011EFE5C9|nr:glycerate kinase [Labrys sp. KNU-23]QEN88844.1 glycerate kinase [Labrys sp. KNU-23]